MSPTLQTVLALLVVAAAVVFLARRFFAKKSGSDCGCPPDKFKRQLRR